MIPEKNKKCIISLGGICLLIATNPIIAGNCRVAATMCEVQEAIKKATFAPPPAAPTPAVVSLSVTTISNIIPAPGIGPQEYLYTITNTIQGRAFNTSLPVNVSCTPTPLYYIYTGGITASGSSAQLAIFDTTTPGTTCPLGTPSCGIPANISLTLPANGDLETAIDTNYNIEFTSTNTGWMAYVTGSYSCSYTDPNLAFPVIMVVPWGQST